MRKIDIEYATIPTLCSVEDLVQLRIFDTKDSFYIARAAGKSPIATRIKGAKGLFFKKKEVISFIKNHNANESFTFSADYAHAMPEAKTNLPPKASYKEWRRTPINVKIEDGNKYSRLDLIRIGVFTSDKTYYTAKNKHNHYINNRVTIGKPGGGYGHFYHSDDVKVFIERHNEIAAKSYVRGITAKTKPQKTSQRKLSIEEEAKSLKPRSWRHCGLTYRDWIRTPITKTLEESNKRYTIRELCGLDIFPQGASLAYAKCKVDYFPEPTDTSQISNLGARIHKFSTQVINNFIKTHNEKLKVRNPNRTRTPKQPTETPKQQQIEVPMDTPNRTRTPEPKPRFLPADREFEEALEERRLELVKQQKAEQAEQMPTLLDQKVAQPVRQPETSSDNPKVVVSVGNYIVTVNIERIDDGS